jgi:hypothetical protein
MNTKTLYLTFSVFFIFFSIYSCNNTAGENKKSITSFPTKSMLIERGKYLVTIMGCNDCHSPKIMGANGPQTDTANTLSGYPSTRPLPVFPADQVKKGFVVVNDDMTAAAGPWGTSYAANITSDTTGIGMWKEEQFINALTHGKYKGLDAARTLMPPMPWQNFITLKKEDSKALFQYLLSTKPVKNVVPPFEPKNTK